MRLFEKETVHCVTLIPLAAEDGEGGSVTEYAQGTAFFAHFKMMDGRADDIAGQVRTCARFTVTVPDPAEGLMFAPGDVLCETETGKLFTVTGEAEKTPSCASFLFLRFPAERWENSSAEAVREEDTI